MVIQISQYRDILWTNENAGFELTEPVYIY